MQTATPAALAALLRRDKEILMTAWEARVRETGTVRAPFAALLHDEIPPLLDELAAELENPATAGSRLREFSAAHGKRRHAIGMHLAQLVEEYGILRSCIVARAEEQGLAMVGEASRIVNRLID